MAPAWDRLLTFARGSSRELSHRADLRTSVAFEDIGEAGPIADAFASIAHIPGWFNIDDCMHFHLILTIQSWLSIEGDLFEIGSYHGRSTALMCRYLRGRERMLVCDAFETPTEDHYANPPSADRLKSNVLDTNPDLDPNQLVIHQCLSPDLRLGDEERFRFMHIDGGHSSEIALSDLTLAKRHLADRGVIVVDDYHNRQWPEVTAGVDRFLSENLDFRILADLNRHGAIGRKAYLARKIESR